MPELEMKLIDPKRLRHIEGFSQRRVEWLRRKIVEEGVWTRPLCIERTHLLVLDGQHRMEVALALELRRVPCVLFDYDDVEVWSLRTNHEVSRQRVIARSLEGDIYPYKTAKHRFPVEVAPVALSLESLQADD
jgi:L-serine kinase (ADP)